MADFRMMNPRIKMDEYVACKLFSALVESEKQQSFSSMNI